jgi:hypothetical protein
MSLANNGMQTGKQEILGLSADDAPDEVPPVGEVGMKCDGVIAIDEIESSVDEPQKIVGERCDDISYDIAMSPWIKARTMETTNQWVRLSPRS